MTYVISSVSVVGGLVSVIGTVNGVPVAVTVSLASVGNNLASAIGFQNFIASVMLAAVPAAATDYPSLATTFTQ